MYNMYNISALYRGWEKRIA